MNMSEKFMRLMVFFDLPVKTKEERRQATQFRNFLLQDGYYMLQYSLYTRICNTVENAKLHEERLKYHLPYKGSVRSLIITEKQYSSISILLGQKKKKDKKITEGQLSFF